MIRAVLRKGLRRGVEFAGRAGMSPALRIRSGPAQGLRIGLERAEPGHWRGTNEAPVQAAVADALSPGAVFYDIGANIGFFTLLAAAQVGPAGRIYAFEPVPENLRCLRANVARNDLAQVEIIDAAAGDREGRAALQLAEHPGGATLTEVPPDPAGQVEVRLVTIDGLVQDQRIRPPDLIKIDVEGAEVGALAGMQEVLRAHQPSLVIEIDGPELAGVIAKRAGIEARLGELGYRIGTLPAAYPNQSWIVEHLLATPAERAASSR